MSSNNRSSPPTWLINSTIVLVVLVWVVNFGARASIPAYDPPEGVDALMLAVVGSLLAGRQASKDEDDDDPTPRASPPPSPIDPPKSPPTGGADGRRTE